MEDPIINWYGKKIHLSSLESLYRYRITLSLNEGDLQMFNKYLKLLQNLLDKKDKLYVTKEIHDTTSTN